MQKIYTVFYSKNDDLKNIAFCGNAKTLQTAINMCVEAISHMYISKYKQSFYKKYKRNSNLELSVDLNMQNINISNQTKNHQNNIIPLKIQDKEKLFNIEEYQIMIIENYFYEDISKNNPYLLKR